MGSRRIQAMAQLIDEIEKRANTIPCPGHGYPCRCQILLLIETYRNQFQAPKAQSARPSSGGSHPTPPPPETTKGSP